MAQQLKVNEKSNALYCPMLDARRMEVYTALYNEDGEEVMPTVAQILDEHFLEKELAKQQILFFGSGAAKFKALLASTGTAKFIDDFQVSATGMAGLAYKKYQDKNFEDVAYFEPFYLKDFVGSK
jgi:tRNA threonylcarbamoyladenosine biosynthesis protein TsaB